MLTTSGPTGGSQQMVTWLRGCKNYLNAEQNVDIQNPNNSSTEWVLTIQMFVIHIPNLLPEIYFFEQREGVLTLFNRFGVKYINFVYSPKL